MALQDKYKQLIDTATALGVTEVSAVEQDNILYVNGTAPSGNVKDQLWDIYNVIDPDFRTGDLILNINVAIDVAVTKVKVITESSNLNIRKGPGTDQQIVGKAAHNEIITLVNRSNDLWWLVRTNDGEEGYCYAKYLTPEP